jgi:dolichol-phosphate mannosyltransferase
MAEADDVCVLVPTLDEVETVGSVVEGFVEQGYTNVLVVDGGSTDGTREAATEAGARVVEQSGSGKGQAVREGLRLVDAPYVLMLDGDGTYDPADADRMLAPLREGRAEHVIGDRFADMREGAMPRLNRVGNRLMNGAFERIHGRALGDILSGYRAFTRESVERLSLTADGFTIETELSVECVKHRVPTVVVPITYRPRPSDSEPNLNPFRDGARILVSLYSLARMNNPLFYFGGLSLASALVGLALAAYVGYEWFVRTPPVSHEVLAVVGGFALLISVQLFVFGVLSDMVIVANREQTRRLEELTRQLVEESGEESAPEAADDADDAPVRIED